MCETVFGQMDQAYFVSKNELLGWLNTLMESQIEYIEDMGTGAVYCQIMDAYFGECMPMRRVKWGAKFHYEFVDNLKLLQDAFIRFGISKKVDIERLAKARYQDNLEFTQWLKRYVELNGTRVEQYHASERRNHASLRSVFQMRKALGNIQNKVAIKPLRSEIDIKTVYTPRQRYQEKEGKEVPKHYFLCSPGSKKMTSPNSSTLRR